MLLDLIGCSTTSPKKKAFAEEELLVAAGFTYKVADTAKKLEKLKSLPQRKLLRQSRPHEVTYLYADVASCKCVYWGDEDAYQRLRRLAYDEKLTEKQEKGIWSTTRVDEVADFATFFDFDEFAGDPD
jgi:4-hydroxyphenylpyruvate dioxygenase-like putative hemolysin